MTPEEPRRVVCAANRHEGTGLIIPGPRHFDETMRALIEACLVKDGIWPHDFEQGFIDQWGAFMSREEAMRVAKAAGQNVMLDRQANITHQLFSEGLY